MFVREFRTTEVGVVLELLRIAGYNSKQLAFALCATPNDVRMVNAKWFAGKRAASITEELWGSSGEKNGWRDLLMKVSKANTLANFNRLNTGRRMSEEIRGGYTREEILSCILSLGDCPGGGSFTKRIAGAPDGETPYTWGLRKEVIDPFWSTVTVDEVVAVVSTVKQKVNVFLGEISEGFSEETAAKKAKVSLKAVGYWREKIEAQRAKNSPAAEARRIQKLKEGFRPLSARGAEKEIDSEESICSMAVAEIREYNY